LSKRKKARRTRRGGKNRKRKPRREVSPGWHLKLEELRRQARKESPETAVKRMRGWELQLTHKPSEEEPWTLLAKPASGTPEWDWLSKAADYLGIPELDEEFNSQRPSDKDGLAYVLWTWKEPPPPPAILPQDTKRPGGRS
jgi:hypothetical protein